MCPEAGPVKMLLLCQVLGPQEGKGPVFKVIMASLSDGM
jgi:hypothetical protein